MIQTVRSEGRTIRTILLLFGTAALSFGTGAMVVMLVFRAKKSRSKADRMRRVVFSCLIGLVIFALACLCLHLATERPESDIAPLSPGSEPVEPDSDSETESRPEPSDEKPGPELLADRLNDDSALWENSEYEFPEGESEVYTSKGRYGGMRVISIASQERSDTVVIYIYGGSYISGFGNNTYYPVVKQITMETGYEVLVPQYPLLPGFNYSHSYTLLQSLYYRVFAEYGNDHVIVMGDSCGGALAAGLCLQAAENGWEQPSQLVLVSPWVDLMITHPETDRYQELDQTLDAFMLRVYGQQWAAGTDPTDYHLSPLYGDVTVLRDVTLYYGDSELFTPMEEQFYEKLAGNGVSCERIIGPGMGHCYAINDTKILCSLCERMVAKQISAEESSP